ncbi:MAG: hypothetical protein WBP72_12140 [Rhodocyclaceae bacterium]
MAYRLILPVATLLASLTAVGFAAGAESAADPTRPPAGLTAGNPSGTASSGPVLQSVIVGKGRRSAAIIGGQRAELGGSYGEAILTRIGEAEVELQGPSGRQVLRMTPEAVKRPLSSAPQHSRGRNATVDLSTKP